MIFIYLQSESCLLTNLLIPLLAICSHSRHLSKLIGSVEHLEMTTAKLVRTALTPISKIWEIYFICQEWISCKHCLILRLSLLKVLLNIMPLVFSSRPPPLCGCIQAEPNYIAQQGDHVSWQRVSHYFKIIPHSSL